MFPSFLCMCAYVRTHGPVLCVFYLHLLCVVGLVCVSYVAGVCTICHREGCVLICLLEKYMIHGAIGVHGVCLVFVDCVHGGGQSWRKLSVTDVVFTAVCVVCLSGTCWCICGLCVLVMCDPWVSLG